MTTKRQRLPAPILRMLTLAHDGAQSKKDDQAIRDAQAIIVKLLAESAADSVTLTYPENPVYTGGRGGDEYTMSILAEIREDKLCGDYLNGANRVTLHPDATLTQGDARFAQFETVTEAATYLERQGWHREQVVLYTIFDASNSFHEAGLTERQLRSRLRHLGYGFDEAWEISDIINKLTEDGDELGIESTED